MDPITLALLSGAVGGAGGKAVESLWQAAGRRRLARYLQDVSDEARAAGQANTVEFLSQLAVRLGRLEDRLKMKPEEAVQQSLRDPDLLVTFNAALLSSARTSDAVKHDVLARAVAERFIAPPDSLSALASNFAVKAIPRLSSHHLQLLALAAVVYVVRPPGLPLAPERYAINFTPDEEALVDAYGSWLKEAVRIVRPIDMPSDADYAHLAAAACITFERGLKRYLSEVLYPYRGRTLSMAARSHFEPDVISVASSLADLWEGGLKQITLTPPGILIGVAAYDQLSGNSSEVDWHSPNITQSVSPADVSVWNGFEIKPEFMRRLGEEVTRSAQRGIHPWDLLKYR